MTIWEKILYKGRSEVNGEIKVTENFGFRRLIASGFTQSQTLRSDGKSGLRYWDSMVPENLKLSPDSRVLILGLAGGTVAKIINKRFGPIAIDGVEIDPLMVELGKKYFEMTDPNLHIIINDAKSFVKDARYKYDLICLDIFKGGKVPEEFESEEFFNGIKSLLKEGGVLTVNKIFSGEADLRGFEGFIKKIFPKARTFQVRGNIALDNCIVQTSI